MLTFNKTVIQHRCCWVLAADACIWQTWQTNWTPSEICRCLWVSSLEIGIRCLPIKTAHEIGLKLLLNNEVSSHGGVIQRWSTEMDVCGYVDSGMLGNMLTAFMLTEVITTIWFLSASSMQTGKDIAEFLFLPYNWNPCIFSHLFTSFICCFISKCQIKKIQACL